MITFSSLVETYLHELESAIFNSGGDKNINIEGIASRLLVIGDITLGLEYAEG